MKKLWSNYVYMISRKFSNIGQNSRIPDSIPGNCLGAVQNV